METLLCPALTLDSRLRIGTAFPGLLGRGGGGGGGVFLYSMSVSQTVRSGMSL